MPRIFFRHISGNLKAIMKPDLVFFEEQFLGKHRIVYVQHPP